MFGSGELWQIRSVLGVKPGGGWGVLPYLYNVGMCRCEGYGFQEDYSILE